MTDCRNMAPILPAGRNSSSEVNVFEFLALKAELKLGGFVLEKGVRYFWWALCTRLWY
jgi:hypothetical protein